MPTKIDLVTKDDQSLPTLMRGVVIEQLNWLISVRWLAVLGITGAGLACQYLFPEPLLKSSYPIYVCAIILLASNIAYLFAARKLADATARRNIIFGIVQINLDLIILTILLHFSGGVINPFILFYVFHVILATIMLPRTKAFSVGLSAILLFGIMAYLEMTGILQYNPVIIPTSEDLGRNPIYVLVAFVAFSATVILAQYLTRTVLARMTAKELEAARNREVLEAVINAMGEGLVFVTNDGDIAICNPQAKQWTQVLDDNGGTTQDISSRRTSEHRELDISYRIEEFPRALADHVNNLMLETRPGDAGTTIKFNLFNLQNRYVEAKSCPVLSHDQRRLGYVIVGQDLTDHKKLERDLRERTEETAAINEMLKRSRIEMAQREKMVAIGQMASGIAHEIGNPLASLSSVAQYLQRKITDPGQKDQLNLIATQVERISTILKRMLSLSRPATSEYKWADVNSIIENTIALVKFDKRARIVDVKSIQNPQLPMVWLNPLHLEQALLNIILNALDAMAARQTDQQHSLHIIRQFENDRIKIEITDTGIGMQPDVCRRAFESFFTTKEIGKGTGLGLYISYNLITEIDGTIALDSQPDHGTTVTITLPIKPKDHLIGSDTKTQHKTNKIK